MAIDDVIRCFKEGGTCIPSMRKRLKRQGNIKQVGDVRQPSLYTVMARDSIDVAKAEPEPEPELDSDKKQRTRTHPPPATVVDDSRTLVKIYQRRKDASTSATPTTA